MFLQQNQVGFLPMMYYVGNNKPTRNKIHHHNNESKEKTGQCIFDWQNWNIRNARVGVANTMINGASQNQKEFVFYNIHAIFCCGQLLV